MSDFDERDASVPFCYYVAFAHVHTPNFCGGGFCSADAEQGLSRAHAAECRGGQKPIRGV